MLAVGRGVPVRGGNEQLLVPALDALALIELLLAPFGLLAARVGLSAFESAHEALDLAGGIDDSLLARVERVALIAEVDPQARPGRLRYPGVAAGANHGRFLVLRVNTRLHCS